VSGSPAGTTNKLASTVSHAIQWFPMHARHLNAPEYAVTGTELRPSPRLIVYRTRLEQNISLMRRYLESVVPSSGFLHITPHVKTHKSLWVTRLLMESGVKRFKCSLNELDMCLEAEAPDIFVAYPLLPSDADRVAERIAQNPGQHVTVQVGCEKHAEYLDRAARRHGVEIDCLLDLNVGYNRTGIVPERASDLARFLPRLPALRFRGIHAYAGHNESADPAERESCSRRTMATVVECLRALESTGVEVERIVVAGTPGFLGDLYELVVRHRVAARVEVSPGTWVYWDGHYEGLLPGLFEFAALILAQVIDLPAPGLLTLNVGSKRWSVDKGPLRLFSAPGLEVVSTSEEHTVLRCSSSAGIEVGDRVLAAPQHVCPTVNLWETFTIVGEEGRLEKAAEPVTARNR